jgi:N-sulfoglucosamine sulfohydrolase
MKIVFASLTLLLSAHSTFADRPNLLLIIADDISWDDLGCYGNKFARTPHLDALAASGRRFDQAFLTASSCSPSRSSIITGRYPHNNGKASELHQPIAKNLAWFPELLRESGYYTCLIGKHHMTVDIENGGSTTRPIPFDFVHTSKIPGNSGGHAAWRKTLSERPREKPFFGWFASNDAHREWESDREWQAEIYGPKHSPDKVIVPPFLVDDQATRNDLTSYYNEITRFDYFVGEVVRELNEQEIFDNTLIFVLADNGRPFPRAKTRLHDSGMKTYLIAHWPKTIQSPGSPTSSLASAIDLAPTFLEAAKIPIPESFQGMSLLPVLSDPTATVRKHAFSEHNWHDYAAHGRAVRSGGYLYIRNSFPMEPWQGPADSVRSPSHLSLLNLKKLNSLTLAQQDVLLAPRPSEELYLTSTDPNQLTNLAEASEHASARKTLSSLLDQWIHETGDDIPTSLSKDGFDRETGFSLKIGKSFLGTPPGSSKNASFTNAPGPR